MMGGTPNADCACGPQLVPWRPLALTARLPSGRKVRVPGPLKLYSSADYRANGVAGLVPLEPPSLVFARSATAGLACPD